MSPSIESDMYVVGIGASAGGLHALERLFGNLAVDTGAAFVVVQHLSPSFKSLMKELLARHTSMSIYRIDDGMVLEANSVYLIPPGQNVTLEGNVLRLEDRKKDKNDKSELNFPIDLFFTSLAENYGEKSIGVILSGSGSDGTRGLKAIDEAGGVVLVQDPQTAEFDGMPSSAIATGVVNDVLPPQELSKLIQQCTNADIFSATELNSNARIAKSDLNRIARLLEETEGLDFSQYKPSTVSRRIHRRCLIHNSANIEEYIDFLSNSSSERKTLCSDLLINVTHFFRNYPAWQKLEQEFLPQLIEQSPEGTELRFWITACSTGEEAYSLAILVHEAILNSDKNFKVKIFATDIDRQALQKASLGIYPSLIARDIDPERLQKYFIARDNLYQVMRKIREMLIFSPHDLTKDAGFTRIHLVTCRNVLIYLKSHLQERVLRNLHFSLVVKGMLFLGEAETLGSFESEFTLLDKKWKFFQKRRDIRLSLPRMSTPEIAQSSLLRHQKARPSGLSESVLEQCLNRLSDRWGAIFLIVDKKNNLLQVSGDSSKIFKALNGKITTEVTKMVVPPLQLPLNTALHRARQKKELVQYRGIEFVRESEIFNFTLEVIPPTEEGKGDFFLVKISLESPAIKPETIEVEQFKMSEEAPQRLIELEKELQQTRENLQVLVEELETTNEEQQASNEELTASNEELQSTNEELHSVNEELHTVNFEYQSKIQELTELNDDIDNLLKSTEIGVVFLDAELRIRKFTPAVTVAISLRETDLERPLEDLHWKFECPDLLLLLQEVLSTRQPIEQEVKLKQAESYLLMQINPYQTQSKNNRGLVISFIKIDEIKQVQLKLEAEIEARRNSEAELLVTKQRVENIFSSLEDAVWSFDLPEIKLGYVNNSFANIYGRSIDDLKRNSALWLDVVHPQDRSRVEAAHKSILQKKIDLEYRIFHSNGSIRWVRDRSKLIYNDSGDAIRQDFIISDITAQKNVQQELKAKEMSFQAVFNSMFQFIGVLNPAGILLEANRTALAFAEITAEEVLNRPFWEAKWWTISEATQSRLKEAIARAAQGEFIRYEVDVLGAEDRVITIDFSLNPVTDESGKVVQIIPEGRDISELKQAREALAQTNSELEQRVVERTQSLARFSDRLQQLYRLATSFHQQQEDLFNDYLVAGCQMLGMSTGIVSQVQDCIYRIVAVNSPLGLEAGYETPCKDTYCAEVVDTQTTITYAEVGKIESMANHPVYLNIKLESFIGTPIFVRGELYGTLNFSDTSPRRKGFSAEEITIIELMAKDLGNAIASVKAQAAIEQSEQKFRSTFEQAAMGMAHVSREGKFIQVNQRLCNIVDYEKNVFVKKTFQEITYPEDLDLDLQHFEQLANGEIDSYSLEKRYIKRDGTIIWVNITVSMVKDSSGQPNYFVATVENIGDRKLTELALELHRDKLKQANQAKDNFIAHMSHELRTPLNSIIGFSHILKQDDGLTKEQLHSIDLVHQSGQHLLTLINDVLHLSKLNANKLELNNCSFNLIGLLQNIVAMFQIRAQEKDLDFVIQIAADLPEMVNMDETRLRQILLNLLSNAFKFTQQGTVTFSATRSRLDAVSGIDRIRFQVEDTGRGIAPKDYQSIFTPFEQLDVNNDTAEGTGLGLSICQNILQLMNSQLHVGSRVGEGSHFWFELDVAVSTSLSSSFDLPQTSVLRQIATPKKVLIVDDNEDNRLLLNQYLQPLGFIVEEADNGLAGLQLAESFQPDVILIDLLMPIMNGKETIEHLRSSPQLKDTVVLMISANIQSIIDSSDIKCDGFLPKPVDLDRLLELLTTHLQLNWEIEIPETTPEAPSIAPDAGELMNLLELVNFGDMETLLLQINSLENRNSQYISFANKIRQLADSCQQAELEEFLQTCLERE